VTGFFFSAAFRMIRDGKEAVGCELGETCWQGRL
jgi:hypothetical protein